ncbi:MAG: hypothetical protein IAF38_22920 [Bacteroidia bacterium]|nr:hypothetical protein [Bacteroidia bacterium]
MRTFLFAFIFFQSILLPAKINQVRFHEDSSLVSVGDTVIIYTGDNFTGFCELVITDEHDKFIWKKKMYARSGFIKLNINFLAPGLYFFEVSERVKIRRHKMLKD